MMQILISTAMKFETRLDVEQSVTEPSLGFNRILEPLILMRGKESTEASGKKRVKDFYATAAKTFDSLKDQTIDGEQLVEKFVDNLPKGDYPDLEKLQKEKPDDYRKLKKELLVVFQENDKDERKKKIVELFAKFGITDEGGAHQETIRKALATYHEEIKNRDLTPEELKKEGKN